MRHDPAWTFGEWAAALQELLHRRWCFCCRSATREKGCVRACSRISPIALGGNVYPSFSCAYSLSSEHTTTTGPSYQTSQANGSHPPGSDFDHTTIRFRPPAIHPFQVSQAPWAARWPAPGTRGPPPGNWATGRMTAHQLLAGLSSSRPVAQLVQRVGI
jgi:hypothetical protein